MAGTSAQGPGSGGGRGAEHPAAAHDWRQGRFPHLMRRRIQEILLVSSPFDAFILEEDGLSTEVLYAEYADLGLTHAPNITRVATGEEALTAIGDGGFDLVITMLRLGDMDVAKFAQAVRRRRPHVPIVLLIANDWELARLTQQTTRPDVDGTYVWYGDTKVILAMIKVLEDRFNAEHDTRVGDVGVIVLVEDSVRFRSSLLPVIYSQLVRQTRAVMADGLNHLDRLLRMAARPKVLIAETFEEAVHLYQRFRKHLVGVVTDVGFPRDGRLDPQAGIAFIQLLRGDLPDVPVLLQSSDEANRRPAEQLGVGFLHKASATLPDDLRRFMLDHFGFGDFVFRTPDGQEVGRARDLRGMLQALRDVPAVTIEYHARHNHFSNWFRARTEFAVARRLRPRRVSEFSDLEDLRRYLMRSVADVLRQNRRGVVEDFSRERFDAGCRFARIGGGALGGKARGLAFVHALLAGTAFEAEFPDIHIHVPRSVVLGTDVFDEFLDANNLRRFALEVSEDDALARAFLAGRLPDEVEDSLRVFLDLTREPLAVRSSSLLEDSQYHPFAGVYETHMLPNNHADDGVRLGHLCDAVKLVYASTFFAAPRRYLEATPHRLEDEKMAVILQPVVGAAHGRYHYPNFAGVARSYNYYPFGTMRPEEGVAGVVLGLGRLVVEGGPALRFCPAHPQVLPQMGDPDEFLNQSQRTFDALDLGHSADRPRPGRDACVVRLELEEAERHQTLALVGSVWSPDDQAFYDGIERPGVRAVTFARVLKANAFPLARLLQRVLGLSRAGMGGAVEIEFAVNVESRPPEFTVLQIRPGGNLPGHDEMDLDGLPRERMVCFSPKALGHGCIAGLGDIVYVRPDRFDPTQTARMAEEIGVLNERLLAANRPYLLIGPGRWGSSHHGLGIPVQWGQISAARVIVETTLDNFVVEPSQGSHFFHNLTSFGVAYLTVNPRAAEGFVEWSWLSAQRVETEGVFVRHVRLDHALEVRVNGPRSQAAVLKPTRPTATD